MPQDKNPFEILWPGNEKTEMSILMPIWNCEEFIESALNSVLGQTGIVVEILISDDASSDGTYALAKKTVQAWINTRPLLHRVLLRRNIERQGRLHFNQLASFASHDIMFEAHGDDVSLPERARILRDLLVRSDLGAGMIFSEAILIDGDGKPLPSNCPSIEPVELVRCNHEIFLEENTSLIGASMAWKNSAMAAFSAPEDSLSAVGLDRIKAFRASLSSNVYWLSTPLYYRRIHNSNLHKTNSVEPADTGGAFARNLIRLAFFRAMLIDLATARALNLVGQQKYDSLEFRIKDNFGRSSQWLLEAYKTIAHKGYKIHWLKD